MKVENNSNHFVSKNDIHKSEVDSQFSEEIPLDEAMQERLRKIDEMHYMALEGEVETKKEFELPAFLTQFINKLFNLEIITEDSFCQGTYVQNVAFGKKYKDVDLVIEVTAGSRLEQTYKVIEQLLQEKEWKGISLEKYIPSLDGSFSVIRLSTTPPLDIMLTKKLPFSCVSSADCFRLIRKEDKWVLVTVDGYDFERSKRLLEENLFEVNPPENALHLHNGILRYCKLLNKGLLPVQEEIEGLFCKGLAKNYPHYLWDTPKRFRNAVRNMVQPYVLMEKCAFLFTLEDILFRSTIEGKEKYLKALSSLLQELKKNKGTFFLEAWKEGAVPLYLKTDLKRPPRYQLEIEGATAFMEVPHAALEQLFAKHTLKGIRQAFELLSHTENEVPADLLEIAIRAGSQHGKEKEALAILRRQIAKLLPLGKETLLPLIEALPKSSYTTLLRHVLNEDWEGYIGAIEDGVHYKKSEQEDLLKLAGIPFVFGEDLLEDLLSGEDARWQEIGLKKAPLERVMPYIEEREIPKECTSILEERLLAALDAKEIAPLFPSIEILASVDFFIRILEKIQGKTSVAFESLRTMLLSSRLLVFEGLVAKNTQESLQVAFALLECGKYPADSVEKAIQQGKMLGMMEEAFLLFRRNIALLYPLGKQRMRVLCKEFSGDSYVKLLGYILDENWSGYIQALDTGTFFEKKEQESLLTLAGSPLKFTKNLTEALLASEQSTWLMIGLKKASAQQVIDYVKKGEIPKEIEPVLRSKLLEIADPDPEVVENILAKMAWNPELKLFVQKAIQRALNENKVQLAVRLRERVKISLADALAIGFEMYSTSGCRFCLEMFWEVSIAEQEKIIFYAIEMHLVAEIFPLLEELASPQLSAKILAQIEKPSLLTARLCQFLLPYLQNNAKARAKAITLLAASDRPREATQDFWQNMQLFKALPGNARLNLLHCLEADPDISCFLEAFEQEEFHYQKYLALIRGMPQGWLDKERQEELLKLIGQPLSLKQMEILDLPEETFLSQISTCEDALLEPKYFRDLVVQRFQEIFPISSVSCAYPLEASVCTDVYLKLKNFLPHAYADKLLEGLPLGHVLKQAILETLFEQKMGKKIDAPTVAKLFDLLMMQCKDDPYVDAQVTQLFKNGALNKWNFSKEVLFGAIRLLSTLKDSERAEAAFNIMMKAIDKHLLKDAKDCLEEQVRIFSQLPGKDFLALLKKIPAIIPVEVLIDKVMYEKDPHIKMELFFYLCNILQDSPSFLRVAFNLLDKIIKEEDKNIKSDLLLHFFSSFFSNGSFSLLKRCLDVFHQERLQGTFSTEQMEQGLRYFLQLNLDDFSLRSLGDPILNQAIELKYKRKDLASFILRYWFVFEEAKIFQLELGSGFFDDLMKIGELQISDFQKIYKTAAKYYIPQVEIPEEYRSIATLFPNRSAHLVPLSLGIEKEKIERALIDFLKFIHLVDHPDLFEVNNFRIVLMKISIAVTLQNPFLWGPDIDRTFDKRWKPPIKSLKTMEPVSQMAASYIEHQYVYYGTAGIEEAKKTFIKGIKGGALHKNMINEMYPILLRIDASEAEAFSEEYKAACLEGGYELI